VRKLGELLVRFRWLVLALLAGAVAVMGSLALSIGEDLSFRTLYLSGDPEIATSGEFDRAFDNSNDMVVVVIAAPDLFRPEILAGIKRITSRSFEGRSQTSVEFNLSADMGKAMQDGNQKLLDEIVETMRLITGQKPVVTRARKSISNFKLRKDMAIGAKVTLRGEQVFHGGAVLQSGGSV
jgi:predicted RND superfamily exporter protein